MAKVRCAKCGEIFGLQQGDIQVCPVCGCRMKVNRKPQADYREKTYESAPSKPAAPVIPERTAASTDEYDTLRREYMEMMRDKLEKSNKGEDGVYLTREEYDALVKKASVPAPAEQPQYARPYSRPAAPAFGRPDAPAPDDYAPYDDAPESSESSESSEFEAAPAVKKSGAKTLINWLSFLFALLAGAMSALLLVLDALKGTKGIDMFLPSGAWSMPASLAIGIIFFAPAVCAVYALISAAIKGKISKFVLMLLFLLCGVAMLFMPFFYDLAQGAKFDAANIASSFGDLTLFDIFAIVLDGLAMIAMFVAGIVISKKRRANDDGDDLL